MIIVSDTVDTNGKRHLVVKYTEEEKAEMEAKKAENKAKLEELRKKRQR